MHALSRVLSLLLLRMGALLSGAVSHRCYTDRESLRGQERGMYAAPQTTGITPTADAAAQGMVMAGLTALLGLLTVVTQVFPGTHPHIRTGAPALCLGAALASLIFVPFYETAVQDMSPGHLMRIAAFSILTGSAIRLREHLRHR